MTKIAKKSRSQIELLSTLRQGFLNKALQCLDMALEELNTHPVDQAKASKLVIQAETLRLVANDIAIISRMP